MKRLHYILLMALLMLAACSGDDASEQATGVGGTIGGAVKTQFCLSVPGLFTAQTRMSAADVMNQPTDFRGMQDIRIFPFLSDSKNEEGEYMVTESTAFTGFTAVSELPGNLIPGFDATDLLHKNQANDKWYTELSIPQNTNSLLIYGRGLRTTDDNTVEGMFEKGITEASFSMTADSDTPGTDISFACVPVYNKMTELAAQPEAVALITLLNKVIGSKGYETADGELEAWSNGNNLLTETYKDFITLRAGSSQHILGALESLYNACQQTTALGLLTAPTGQKTLPEAIQESILTATSADGAAPRVTLKWKNDPMFPACYHIPDGAVQVEYVPAASAGETGTFAYRTAATQYDTYTLDYARVTFPAELWYRSVTAIRTSDTEQNDHVADQSWADFVHSSYDDHSRTVDHRTRSIAAITPLQFAVARMDTYLRFASGQIYARDPKSPTDETKQVAVSIPDRGFRILGLLIADQPSRVGWDFRPVGIERSIVYDSAPSDADAYVPQTAFQTVNPVTHTLLFESVGVPDPNAEVVADTNDEVVNVAIEMENNSASPFYGEDGFVPVGGRFYLVAQLRLSDKEHEANERHITSIFKQDHITVLDGTIHTLRHAFNNIPDLTVPAQELGISIDLQWKDGAIIQTTIK